MTGVTDFKVSLIKADGSRQEVITAEDGDELPVGIEIRITTELWGDLIRRVNLPEYIPFAMQGGTGALEAENNVNDIETDQNDEFDPASQPFRHHLMSGLYDDAVKAAGRCADDCAARRNHCDGAQRLHC